MRKQHSINITATYYILNTAMAVFFFAQFPETANSRQEPANSKSKVPLTYIFLLQAQG